MAPTLSGDRKLCCGFLAAVVAGGFILAGCGGSDAQSGEVGSAAVAPYIAVLKQDAQALCGDFTPMIANRLARRVSQSPSCDRRVAEAFARSAPFEPRFVPGSSYAFKTGRVIRRGDMASAVVAYGADDSSVQVALKLVKIGGAWRVASQPMMRLASGCYVRGVLTGDCPKDARVLLFSIGEPEQRG
jgi:hypothetical protein